MPVPNGGWGLREAVGLTDEGTQCPNLGFDQQQVGELLDAVGLPAGGMPLDALPPIESGFATPEFCEAIRTFQTVQSGLIPDARVDVGKNTWRRLIALGMPSVAPPGGTPVMLSVSTLDVVELPKSASGLPSLTYTIKGPVATYAAPGIRIELSASGPLKVSWESAFPLACQLSPEMAALEAAVASGAARVMGGIALDNLSTKLKVESRVAVNDLFASISLRVGSDRTPVLSGSIGDDTHFQSMDFNPVEQSLTYRATKKILKSHSVTGGEVEVSGDLFLELKVIAEEEAYEASTVIALLVIGLGIGVVRLIAVRALAGIAPGEVVPGVGGSVPEIVPRLGPVTAGAL